MDIVTFGNQEETGDFVVMAGGRKLTGYQNTAICLI